jgi:5-histidylcysteine sulfoxide synthase
MISVEQITRLLSQRPPKLDFANRRAIKDYFDNSWNLYELLFSAIKVDSTLYESPDPLRNPLVFYLGHTAAFYINKFKLAGLIDHGVHEEWDQLFAVGVDPNLPQNLEVSEFWPSISEVRSYRKTIYKIVHQVIDQLKESDFPITPQSPLWAIPMTIEHDRIHLETSSVLIRQLAVDKVERPADWSYAPANCSKPTNKWIEMPAGNIQLGKPADSPIFGWDNEYGALKLEIAAFRATQNLISNQDFLNFLESEGYDNPDYWTPEGWKWKTRTNSSHPKFWVASEQGYQYRAMFDEMEMPLDWPVEVNAHEAQAYCSWNGNGSRLLTEAEFNCIGRQMESKDFDPLFTDNYNLNVLWGSPSPVGFVKTAQTAAGFNDIYGNLWEWLSDDFYAFSNFETHPFYEEFSAPYMDEDHGMMAGGSWITTGTAASRYYRLWFRRHFFQHCGFRLAQSL